VGINGANVGRPGGSPVEARQKCECHLSHLEENYVNERIVGGWVKTLSTKNDVVSGLNDPVRKIQDSGTLVAAAKD